jgi:hypothetical protein
MGDCYNGKGVYKTKFGHIYEGDFAAGYYHGSGIMKYFNKDKYLGNFQNGKKHGNGKYIYALGHEYIGQFETDVRQGKGKITYKNGESYQGAWVKDNPQGQGEYFFADGSKYVGEFLNGNFHGNGKFIERDGQVIDGTWQNNKIVSAVRKENMEPSQNQQLTEHTYSSTNSTAVHPKRMKDCTNQYCHEEQGKFKYKDGSVYTGLFTNGKPEGKGECAYITGDVYKGGWKDHGPHGIGTMFKKDGGIHSGTWHYGSLVKRDHSEQAITRINKEKDKKIFNEAVSIYAVVVGVASYNHMSSLRYTDDDAYHLYAFLKSPEGGAIPDENIAVLVDDAATRKNILGEMSSIFSKADANDVIILYMSGHGLDGAFVPVDFDGVNNLLAYDDILAMINTSAAKHKLYITDACHSGSMYAAKSGYDSPLRDFYSRFNTTKASSAIITSSKKDEVSLEYSGMRHGVFSHYLIEGLKGDANKNDDKVITVKELFDYISLNVRHHTANGQNPAIHGQYDPNMPVAFIR